MRKSTLFISAVLTTFVMAMLAGVASAYQGIVSNGSLNDLGLSSQAQSQPETKSVANNFSAAEEFQPIDLTPEQAAGLAAQVLGRDDLYSVEVTELNGETVFMVTFSSGDLVYVSLDGQIRSIGKVQVETVVVSSGGGGGGGGGNNNGGQPPAASQEREDEHDEEDHEDHQEERQEEHEEDED